MPHCNRPFFNNGEKAAKGTVLLRGQTADLLSCPIEFASSWLPPLCPHKITFAEMRDMGVRGVLIYWRRLSLQPFGRGLCGRIGR
jgi:hypothetical protein